MHRYSKAILIADPLYGIVSTSTHLLVHDRALCKGRKCVLHNPSKHHMRKWQKVVRLDKRTRMGDVLIERTCPHGVGHPDPDALAYIRSVIEGKTVGWGNTMSDMAMHGCDGCCKP